MTTHPNPNLPGGHQARRPYTSPTPGSGPSADTSPVRGRARRFMHRRPVLAAITAAAALAAAVVLVYGLAEWLVSHLPDQAPQTVADFRIGFALGVTAVIVLVAWLFRPSGAKAGDEA